MVRIMVSNRLRLVVGLVLGATGKIQNTDGECFLTLPIVPHLYFAFYMLAIFHILPSGA